MRHHIFFTLSVLLLVASAVSAGEGTQQWNRHEGPYAEVNVGTNLYYLGAFSSAGDASDAGFQGFGWTAAAGYAFTPNHAIEGGFMQNYLDFEVEEDSDTEVSTHTNIVYLTWRGTVPIRDRFAFFGKLGGMLASVPDTDESAWVILPFTGLGVSYAMTPAVDLSVQYQGAVYGIVGGGALTVGATYHF
jgi:hypothetical protein